MKKLFEMIFGCSHSNYSFPQTSKGETSVSCLDCGKSLTYDFAGLGETLAPPRLTAPRVIELPEGKYTLSMGAGQ